jgi:hypothetical protein
MDLRRCSLKFIFLRIAVMSAAVLLGVNLNAQVLFTNITGVIANLNESMITGAHMVWGEQLRPGCFHNKIAMDPVSIFFVVSFREPTQYQFKRRE